MPAGDPRGEVTASVVTPSYRPGADLPMAPRRQWRYTVAGVWSVVCDYPLARDLPTQLVDAYHGHVPCRVLVLPGVYAEIRSMS